MKRIGKKSIILTALFLLAGAAIVFAHGGGMGPGMMGQGRGSGMGMGPGMMSDGDGWGRGYAQQLSKEDAQKLEAARSQFFNDTRTLREQIAEKRLTMQAELVNQNPDSARLTKMQQELSQLEAQFDQKALQHRIEVRKIVPDAAMGMGRGMGKGRCW
jgi:zinc resistance-associated protein